MTRRSVCEQRTTAYDIQIVLGRGLQPVMSINADLQGPFALPCKIGLQIVTKGWQF